MDCVIPSHSVRSFCASIGCSSRIGKDLYVEFDPIDGLALRSLNDAKSAYACFRFEPSFFERCTTPLNTESRKRTLTEASQELRFSCRVAVRALAAVVRPRKNVVSLRVRSKTCSSALYLSFEFHLKNSESAALLRVVHRIQFADAEGVSAVASKEEASEIVASPKVLLRLLEPLKRTGEATLIVRSDAQMVSAASFHHTQAGNNTDATNNNAILQATSASLLKTETAITCDEFEDFDFRDNRQVDESMPESVNNCVILVFPIKEAKAMLQFCSQHQSQYELRVSLSFHWGSKPLVLEATTDSFSAEVVLATLDHKLLDSLYAAERETAAVAVQQSTNRASGEGAMAVKE